MRLEHAFFVGAVACLVVACGSGSSGPSGASSDSSSGGADDAGGAEAASGLVIACQTATSDGQVTGCNEVLDDPKASSVERSNLIKVQQGICSGTKGGVTFSVVSACPTSKGLLGYCEIHADAVFGTQRGYHYELSGESADEAYAKAEHACLTDGQSWFDAKRQQVVPSTTPLDDVVGVAGGRSHACAWTSTGEAYCWGNNESGQLGNGEVRGGPNAVPLKLADLEGVVSMSASTEHTCAVLDSGVVYCWGKNDKGQVTGNASSKPVASPVKVDGVSNATSVFAGTYGSCALDADGVVTCWGQYATTPGETTALDLPKVTALSPSGMLCVMFEDGSIACPPCSSTLCDADARDATDIAALGGGAFELCEVNTSQQVVCQSNDTWTPVDGIEDAAAVSTSVPYDCALSTSGTVQCWPSPTGTLIPGVTQGITKVVEGATSLAGACAALEDGTVSCWGSNGSGERGNRWPEQASHHEASLEASTVMK
jgi:alpha-tubulin suppressor-like RCC1 family protein